MQPPVTQDNIVNVITTLAAMLGEVTVSKESAIKATHAAVDLAASASNEMESLREQLEISQNRCRRIQEDLDSVREARERASGFASKATLFDAFLRDPARMMDAFTYLRSNLAEVSSNKIVAIKRVREIAGLGLKEAKDMVESFFANPVCAYPPPPAPAPVDPNPCRDGGCLNAE